MYGYCALKQNPLCISPNALMHTVLMGASVVDGHNTQNTHPHKNSNHAEKKTIWCMTVFSCTSKYQGSLNLVACIHRCQIEFNWALLILALGFQDLPSSWSEFRHSRRKGILDFFHDRKLCALLHHEIGPSKSECKNSEIENNVY